ncbi:MAG: DNA polymerase III subunit delta [Clostridia bacterium]|nr:DNA polymerase III subunit delta [Clostridia bacterium]
MAVLSESDFRKRIKTELSGTFLFYGAEDYLKSYCITAARQAVCADEGLACFNDITIDFPDYTADALENALAAPPMMSECKLVVVKSMDFTAMKVSDQETLLGILETYKEDTSNLLILSVVPDGIETGTAKKPNPLFAKLSSLTTVVHFEEATPPKLAVWVQRHCASLKVGITDRDARLLIEICGRSMYTLASEIEKLCFYVLSQGRSTVTEQDIHFVSIPAEECDTFALTNAAMAGKRKEALDALAVMKARQIKPEMVFGEISRLYADLYLTKLSVEGGKTAADISSLFHIHSYKAGLYVKAAEKVSFAQLRRILALCESTDLAMKSYGKRNYEQIEKLICLI